MKIVWVWLVAAVVSMVMVACEEPGEGPVDLGAPPPANAEYLDPDVTAQAVMFSGARLRPGQTPTAVPSDAVGMWVPEPGWDGAADAVTPQGGGTTIGMKQYAQGLLGGEFWVICRAPKNCGVHEGDQIAVQGKIEAVEVKLAGPTPTFRIILDKVRILSHQKR